MSLLAIDLGGTKLAIGIFTENGELIYNVEIPLSGKKGKEVGELIINNIKLLLNNDTNHVSAIGISVPGISNSKKGTVWAPNIPNWDDYPLLEEVRSVSGKLPVSIESDRSCYILGEMWQGNAVGCTNAIFVAVGTGIGAGIVSDGNVLHGAADIAGAIGWMALENPYRDEYVQCGCFEYNASGNGIAKIARRFLSDDIDYAGELRQKPADEITSHDVFEAFEQDDTIAIKVINHAIAYWGTAIANLVSIFNPEKIILGGGVFGPAVKFIPSIRDEVLKWAQPISARQVKIEASLLGSNAGIYGAGYLALQLLKKR